MKLEQYIRGERTGRDAHELERAAMDDPLLAEALEGYEDAGGGHDHDHAIGRLRSHVDLAARMRGRMGARMRQRRRLNSKAWIAAASLLLCIVLGSYLLITRRPAEQIALSQTPPSRVPASSAEAGEQTQQQAGQPVESSRRDSEPAAVLELLSSALESKVHTVDSRENMEALAEEIAAAPDPVAAAAHSAPKEEAAKTSLKTRSLSDLRPEGISPSYRIIDRPAASRAKTAGKEILVRGKVTDSLGQVLPGTVVSIPGTQRAVVAGADGRYAIAAAQGDSIRFSHIGFDSRTILAQDSGGAKNDIALSHSNTMLAGMVVTGYQTIHKEAVVGAVNTVKKEDIRAKDARPAPVDGMRAYKNYLRRELRRPADKEGSRARGKVVVRFGVDPLGRPADVEVVKSLCPSCDREAVRLVMGGPGWLPSSRKAKVIVRF